MTAVMSVEKALKDRYSSVRDRLWPVAKPEPEVTIAPPPVSITAPVIKPPVRLVWVRQCNAHVIAYRQWQLAEEQGKEYVPQPPRRDVHEIIMDVLADFPEFTLADIKGPRKWRRLALARQIAVYEVYKQRPDLSFPQIGRIFGGRDHTTILHAVRKMELVYGKALG